MCSLYLDYEAEIKMEEPFNSATEFVAEYPDAPPAGGVCTPVTKTKLAFIESTAKTDVLTMEYKLSGQSQVIMGPTGPMPVAGSVQVMQVLEKRGWETE